jgi:hypothetical protein
VPIEAPREVGHHHDRALEHPDEQEVLAVVVDLDLLGHLAEPGEDLFLGVQDLVEVELALDVLVVHGVSLPQGLCRSAGRRPPVTR